jgi:hypothetical protein
MTERSSLERYLFDAIASVVPPHGGAYVAGPLASGKRHYELLFSGDEVAASQVRSENEKKCGLLSSRFVSGCLTR